MDSLKGRKRRALPGRVASAIAVMLGLVRAKGSSWGRCRSTSKRSARRAETIVPAAESAGAETAVGQPVEMHELSWNGTLQGTDRVVVQVLPT